MSAIIQIQNLTFGYGDSPALRHINLMVEPETTLGLIGPNGGGKTTLMRLMLGQLRAQEGRIEIAGFSPGQAVRKGDVLGYLPQKAQFSPNLPLTVRQAVRLGLAGKTGLMRSYDKSDVAFVEQLLERLGLSDMADGPVGALSGGQAQRAFIARALAPRPRILLMDEPTTGIDRAGQQKFIELVQELKRELKLTVVFCSHDLRAVSSISDRVACLNVQLHYHDVPHEMPAQLAYEMFACDLEAMGIRTPAHNCECGDPGHLHAGEQKTLARG